MVGEKTNSGIVYNPYYNFRYLIPCLGRNINKFNTFRQSAPSPKTPLSTVLRLLIHAINTLILFIHSIVKVHSNK